MNSKSTPAKETPKNATKPRKGLFWGLVVVLFIVIALPIYAVTSVLRMGAEALAVRDTVVPIASVSGQCDKRIELNLGGGLLGLARMIGGIADIPYEARCALNAVHRVQVGVYYLPEVMVDARDQAAFMNRTTAVLDQRDWQRIVGVVDGGDIVGIFIPRVLEGVEDIDVCVVVLDGHDLVVVSARADLRPLIPLIREKISEV